MHISTDMTVSVLYARLNGVSLLLVLGIVLWAHSTFGSSSTQLAPSWCNLVLIHCMMLLLARSTAPFACGWYFSFPGASVRGPTMSIPYFLKGHVDVTDTISSFGSLGTVTYA
ncbi:hypothetical protein Tco_1158856 [Tanacetum coccineum]